MNAIIISTKCTLCQNEKDIEQFYKNPLMKSGYANQCKECVKARSRKREAILSKNPEWTRKEKNRNRLKYHRLNYRIKHKPTPEAKRKAILKYREKYPEKAKAKSSSSTLRRKLRIKKGLEFHHWSYRREHRKDVIILSVADHNTAHRFLKYEQSEKMYKTIEGELLDTKEKHVGYIENFIKSALV